VGFAAPQTQVRPTSPANDPAVLKIFGFIRRRDDFAWPAFSAYWRTTHREEALKLRPWLRRYHQDHLLPEPAPGFARPAADGCPVLWVESAEALAQMIASQEYMTGAYIDEPRFMDGRSGSLAVLEQVVLPPPRERAGLVKLSLFWRRAPQLTALEFAEQFQASIRPLNCSADHAAGYIRNTAIPTPDADPRYAFDCVEEIWWASQAAADQDWAKRFSPASVDPGASAAAWVEDLVVI
jgi:hypothetical protein